MSYVQIVLYLLALVLPPVLAVKYRAWGVVAGGAVCWVTLGTAMYPGAAATGLGGVVLMFWLLFGWPLGVTYATVGGLVIGLVARAIGKWRRRASIRAAEQGRAGGRRGERI